MSLVIARRSPYDRDILRLALPAFGALTAEPLYVLADTAIVGHLGTQPLAGLAIAGTVLTAAYGLCNFLAYSTTAAVARQVGAGDRRTAARQGVDGLWLGLGIGLLLTMIGLALAPQIVHVMGASHAVEPYAVSYLRISIVGAPAMLIALAGAGYLRGVQDTRTTLVIAVAANVANLLLELFLVYGLDLGIEGSAWGTVAAQVGAAAAYLVVVGRHVRAVDAPVRPDLDGIRANARVGSRIMVRTAALLVAFVLATAIASRIDDTAVAAHQIAIQLLLFLSLALDAIAIAAQAMVGHALGAGDAPGARAASRRMVEWGVVLGVTVGLVLALAAPWLAGAFTNDPHVEALARDLLWILAAMQPVAAVAFVLDGVLIGAGDAGYLATAMVLATAFGFLPVALLVLAVDAGVVWLWVGLACWMVARLVGVAARYRGEAWAVVGARR